MGAWVHRFMGSWVHGFMGSWVHGFMDSSLSRFRRLIEYMVHGFIQGLLGYLMHVLKHSWDHWFNAGSHMSS